eukprot:g8224.t1
MSFDWWPLVDSCVLVEGASAQQCGSTHTLGFKDGTTWTIQLREFSELRHTLSFDVIASEPALQVASALHSLSLTRVTLDNTTFVQWTTDFTNDAGIAVVQDSRYKKLDAFTGLGD